MSNFAKAKQALLASGLPLEMSVERQLISQEFQQVAADFTYWRRAEGGHKDFSVDAHALKAISTPWVTTTPDSAACAVSIYATWDILLECKYRNPSVKWLFAPRPKPSYAGQDGRSPYRSTHFAMTGRGHLAIGPEAGHLDVRPRDAQWKANDSGFPLLVTRGVEFKPASSNDESHEAFSASIRRGVHQLQYAHVPRLSDTLSSVGRLRGSETLAYPQTHVHISTLLLVTTAELWTFRPEVDLASVERADELAQIAEQVHAVEFETVLSRELRAHQEEWVAATTRSYEDRTEDPPEVKVAREQIRSGVAEILRSASPSVLIVSHDYLAEFLTLQSAAIAVSIRKMAEEFAKSKGYSVR